MGNSTSFPTTPPPTPNINEDVGELSKSTSGTNIRKNISLANRRQSYPNIKPNLNIKKNNLNDHKVNRSAGSVNSDDDTKLQRTELTTDNSKQATNTAQAAPKQNDTPIPNDAATVTNASVLPDTSAAEKPSGENTAKPDVNDNKVASENSTNNVNGNESISGENNVAKVSADPKIRYDEKLGGYWVLNIEIPTIFKDETNAKKFMDIMKGFRLEEDSLQDQLLGYDAELRTKEYYAASAFFDVLASGVMQPASWGFASGNNEKRNRKVQETKSKIEQIKFEIKKTMDECVDPLSMPQDKSKAWQLKLEKLQTDLDKSKAELAQIPSFWDCQPTDEAKLVGAEYTKELYATIEWAKEQQILEKLIPNAQVNDKIKKLEKKINRSTSLKKQIEKFTSRLGTFNKIFNPLLNFLRNLIESLNNLIESLKYRQALPGVDFVKAIVNLANKPKYQIACIEGTIGDMSLGWQRGFTPLTNGLNQAILKLIWDKTRNENIREDNGVTVETLNNFAQIYGEETLDKTVRALYTLKAQGFKGSELKGTYEAYWKQSGRKGKCPVDKVFDNKIRELNWPDSKLKPPESVANPAKSDN